jgi:hypothetical protein
MTIGHDERHALLEELDLLRERRREIEETLEVDDRPHDVGDQSEATQRRDDLDWIDLRIRDLTHYLYAAAVRDNVPPERVGVGAVVTIRYPDGDVETVQVAFPTRTSRWSRRTARWAAHYSGQQRARKSAGRLPKATSGLGWRPSERPPRGPSPDSRWPVPRRRKHEDLDCADVERPARRHR